jgi:hypothetical protein
VRQDDRGDSWVTFGDGVRGARLPSGAGNVVASYRFGAGAASPPAGSVNQLARPVPGLASVGAALAPGGGADAEPAESLRELAPRSALLLGARSDRDMGAARRPGPRHPRRLGLGRRASGRWSRCDPRRAGVRAAVEARLRAPSPTRRSRSPTRRRSRRRWRSTRVDPRQVATAVLATVCGMLVTTAG